MRMTSSRRSRLISFLIMMIGALMVMWALFLVVSNERLDRQSGEEQAAPEGNMPVAYVDGIAYIGILEIPSLGLTLPIQSEWTDATARLSPGRLSGSLYANDLLLAGQSYQSQFGEVGRLKEGDSVSFVDIYGNRFDYRVNGVFSIDGKAPYDTSGADGDLLLCTYTMGGLFGVCVSCAGTSA